MLFGLFKSMFHTTPPTCRWLNSHTLPGVTQKGSAADKSCCSVICGVTGAWAPVERRQRSCRDGLLPLSLRWDMDPSGGSRHAALCVSVEQYSPQGSPLCLSVFVCVIHIGSLLSVCWCFTGMSAGILEYLRNWASLVPNQSLSLAQCWHIERLVGTFSRRNSEKQIKLYIIHIIRDCSSYKQFIICIIILVHRASPPLTKIAQRNMGKYGGKSACCNVCFSVYVKCLCFTSSIRHFCMKSSPGVSLLFVLFYSFLAFLMAVSRCFASLILPWSKLFW